MNTRLRRASGYRGAFTGVDLVYEQIRLLGRKLSLKQKEITFTGPPSQSVSTPRTRDIRASL